MKWNSKVYKKKTGCRHHRDDDDDDDDDASKCYSI